MELHCIGAFTTNAGTIQHGGCTTPSNVFPSFFQNRDHADWIGLDWIQSIRVVEEDHGECLHAIGVSESSGRSKKEERYNRSAAQRERQAQAFDGAFDGALIAILSWSRCSNLS